MTKNRTPTPVYLDPGMHPGLEVKGFKQWVITLFITTNFIDLKLRVPIDLSWMNVYSRNIHMQREDRALRRIIGHHWANFGGVAQCRDDIGPALCISIGIPIIKQPGLYSIMQSQKAVSAYFTSKQILPSSFADQPY